MMNSPKKTSRPQGPPLSTDSSFSEVRLPMDDALIVSTALAFTAKMLRGSGEAFAGFAEETEAAHRLFSNAIRFASGAPTIEVQLLNRRRHNVVNALRESQKQSQFVDSELARIPDLIQI
jgi:hypothetical protein